MSETRTSPAPFVDLFQARRAAGRLALLPYLMAGYPSHEATVELMERMEEAGADGFELGIPFSDPLADGPTVQRASQAALAGGMNPPLALELLARARQRVSAPVALMGYMNPIVKHGVERFCRDAAAAGAQGLIVPDVPPEEAGELSAACLTAGLDLVAFVAPTTSSQRVKTIAQAARGFIYIVSLTGVTGARADLAVGLEELLGRVRALTTTPVVVGFGISRPEHVAWLAGRADGAIVASALIDLLELSGSSGVADVARFVGELRAAADAAPNPTQ